jgi:hypothetical protein
VTLFGLDRQGIYAQIDNMRAMQFLILDGPPNIIQVFLSTRLGNMGNWKILAFIRIRRHTLGDIENPLVAIKIFVTDTDLSVIVNYFRTGRPDAPSGIEVFPDDDDPVAWHLHELLLI